MTVLMTSCKNSGPGSLELIKFLIESFGADISYASNQGTPFLKAVGSNNMQVVDWMVEKNGPDFVNQTDLNGVNALYCAVFRGNK